MPTNRTRKPRTTRALNQMERAALTVGTGANNWTDEEREQLRELWRGHGEGILRQCPNAWGLLEFGQPDEAKK